MPPSASKQKRLAEKAAKQAAKANATGTTDASSTLVESAPVSSTGTPFDSKNPSSEDLSMAKLALATDRFGCFRVC